MYRRKLNRASGGQLAHALSGDSGTRSPVCVLRGMFLPVNMTLLTGKGLETKRQPKPTIGTFVILSSRDQLTHRKEKNGGGYMKIVATVSNCVQVGMDNFRDVNTSRVFDENRTIKDILQWASTETGKPVTCIGMIQFSDYTGESL